LFDCRGCELRSVATRTALGWCLELRFSVISLPSDKCPNASISRSAAEPNDRQTQPIIWAHIRHPLARARARLHHTPHSYPVLQPSKHVPPPYINRQTICIPHNRNKNQTAPSSKVLHVLCNAESRVDLHASVLPFAPSPPTCPHGCSSLPSPALTIRLRLYCPIISCIDMHASCRKISNLEPTSSNLIRLVYVAQRRNSLEHPVDCSAKSGARDYANAFDSRLLSSFVALRLICPASGKGRTEQSVKGSCPVICKTVYVALVALVEHL
jgi:hypothetical protein